MEHPKYSFRKDATDAVSIFGWETELNRIVLDGIARNPIPNSCHRSMENETNAAVDDKQKIWRQKSNFTSVESPLTIGALRR